jgi:hypothetical protein
MKAKIMWDKDRLTVPVHLPTLYSQRLLFTPILLDGRWPVQVTNDIHGPKLRLSHQPTHNTHQSRERSMDVEKRGLRRGGVIII